jgi:23S rRNA (guanine2445-N2)-methyltransferase / 23S rRNA (guanine2069-N7)-methyltransferase
MNLQFFASCARALPPLLARELAAMPGVSGIVERQAGVSFNGPLEAGYRACLWSRTASRVLLELARFPVAAREDLYRGAAAVDWHAHLAADGSFAVEASGSAPGVNNSFFAAQVVKDAVVDALRTPQGSRPVVRPERPDVQLNLRLQRGEAVLSLDLAGEPLHRRGYRGGTGEAPLKETLAAALLLWADWPAIAARSGPLFDPLCGSGTLLIEGAWMAARHAPGMLRDYWGFLGWQGHVPALWQRLLTEARAAVDWQALPPLQGADQDAAVIRAARGNAQRAGVPQAEFMVRALADTPALPGSGLLITNPPYGERLASVAETPAVFAQLGQVLRSRLSGWRAAILVPGKASGYALGLRASATRTVWNGPLECLLLTLDVAAQAPSAQAPTAAAGTAVPASAGAAMFANRLRKNLKQKQAWATREGIRAWRLYDADMPEYALALDVYDTEADGRHVVAQEYAAPPGVDPRAAGQRLGEALAVIPEVLDLVPARLHYKRRERQRGTAQYRRQGAGGVFHEVREGGARLRVNFTDFLDTGLFLDHRPVRALIQREAAGRSFLNLFCYTASASVLAAAGGAARSLSLDMSATYLSWAEENYRLNGLYPPEHQLLQADCLAWLEQQAALPAPRRFGLILLDPPAFSNSKRMAGVLDIQRDHPRLIRAALRLLAADGLLVFSCNLRRFKLEAALVQEARIEDWTAPSIPHDFARDARIHHCWLIRPLVECLANTPA